MSFESPTVILDEFLSRFGFDRREAGEGSAMMYAKIRSFDSMSEEFRSQWVSVASSGDPYETIGSGFDEIRKRLESSMTECLSEPEGVNRFARLIVVEAVAVVSYGAARATDNPDEERIIEGREARELSMLYGDDLFDCRMVVLCSLRGLVTQLVVMSQETGEVVERIVDEQLVDDDSTDEMRVSGRLDFTILRGWAMLLMFDECIRDRGSLEPLVTVRHALETEFPFADHLVKAMLHAVVESTELSSESCLRLLEMLESGLD